MMDSLSHRSIGRILSVINPELVASLVEQYTPLSKDLSIIPMIYHRVEKHFPEMEAFDRKLLFIACVYRIVIPASFLPALDRPDERCSQAVNKLPPGFRNEVARCAGITHSPDVNRLKGYIDPFMKNPRYRTKVKVITDAVGLTNTQTLNNS